ncbi:hypothetical protein ARALYDRAFT_474220, partial [Arabidopsis lyrata subsp. lyrata]
KDFEGESDLCDLTTAAIKATYNTRNPCEVERMSDASISIGGTLICKEAQALFHSWLKTIYAQGSDNSFKADHLKMKKHVLTRCSELKKKEVQRSMAREKFIEASQSIYKSLFKLSFNHTTEFRFALEDDMTKKPREDVTYVLSFGSLIKKTIKTEKELYNKKVDEMVKQFVAANKAVDVANTKGVLSGKREVSRCIDALLLLMKINITPKPKEPRRMMDKLEGFTKHKDRKICHVASALLHFWRQRIREQERKDSGPRRLLTTLASLENLQICEDHGLNKESL